MIKWIGRINCEVAMERNLILFFSRAGQNIVGDQIVELEQGNSEYVARLIQEAVGGTLFKIETREDYPEDYEKCLDVAKDEMRKRFRPELKSFLGTASSYENIIVCGPCWWDNYPMAVIAQMELIDCDGKNVLPVMTYETGKVFKAEDNLKDACNGHVGKALLIKGSEIDKKKKFIKAWAKASAGEYEES